MSSEIWHSFLIPPCRNSISTQHNLMRTRNTSDIPPKLLILCVSSLHGFWVRYVLSRRSALLFYWSVYCKYICLLKAGFALFKRTCFAQLKSVDLCYLLRNTVPGITVRTDFWRLHFFVFELVNITSFSRLVSFCRYAQMNFANNQSVLKFQSADYIFNRNVPTLTLFHELNGPWL